MSRLATRLRIARRAVAAIPACEQAVQISSRKTVWTLRL
jgi:hypothetical protein